MDARRFDALARSLVAPGDRRRVLRGLTLGAAALLAARRSGVATQTNGTIALGEPCQTSAQCQQDFMGSAIVCAGNAIEKDGTLNCCRADGCCVRDADCCGDRLCAPSGDVCAYCALPPFPTRLLGETCGDDAECVPSVVGSVICADNGIAKDGPLSCCFEAGGSCAAGEHGHCCGALRCVEGRCRDSAAAARIARLRRWLLGRAGLPLAGPTAGNGDGSK
jgi:hypothetical protein